ncbi:MAG TPA: cob(I)yrinic acid a,c-diamide adenosyltransferase [Myxococcota bacterium]|jgi:cob(I)alamin adenosyltransferase|nr:cob(I)yrinic acid a,c-diamide adenosyltransferase [Myxococcota bacterium]
MALERGYVHVYTGDGKGKTSAALGLCLRAVGHGLRCFVIQFMKGNVEYGELEAAKALGTGKLEIRQMGREAREDSGPVQIDLKWAEDGLRLAAKVFEKGEHDVVVLDEVVGAVNRGLLKVDDVLRLLDKRPDGVEVVLTGTDAPPEILAAGHVVTVMRAEKHYAAVGVRKRAGIDY